MTFSRPRIIVAFLLAVALGFGLWCLYGYLAIAGIESPAYIVAVEYDDYEIREYGPTIVATTTVDGNLDGATVAGFKKVAGYIFGENTLGQNIAMTAPVTTEQAHSGTDGGSAYAISFVLPSEYGMEDLPLPSDAMVRVESVPARTLAVYSFSGVVDELDVAGKMADFESELEKAGYTVSGELTLAQYNPPYTPWFMRHNEIWAELLLTR